MQIDWSKAPDWAQFVAMDSRGLWYWYEKEPRRGKKIWVEDDGMIQSAGESEYWQNTLQRRPTE